MLTPRQLLNLTIYPMLDFMADECGIKSGRASYLMLMTIAQQESLIKYRRQVGGPAVSWWQFEKGGGVRGVLTHERTKPIIIKICSALAVPYVVESVYEAMPHNDLLSCAMARLLLYSDPRPLPTDAENGWQYYLRNWRPGKPHPDTWGGFWAESEAALEA